VIRWSTVQECDLGQSGCFILLAPRVRLLPCRLHARKEYNSKLWDFSERGGPFVLVHPSFNPASSIAFLACGLQKWLF